MSLNWKDFFYASDRVTNVKIVCNNGILFTHKIIVASADNFFKDIISNIPTGDEAILIMPNHEKIQVKNYLQVKGSFSNEIAGRKPAKNEELRPFQVKNEEMDQLLGSDSEGNSDSPTISNVETIRSDVDLNVDGSDYEDDGDGMKSEAIFQDESVKKDFVKEFVDSMDENEKQEYHKAIIKYLLELERRERMINPGSPKETKLLNYTQKQIKYEKAKLDLLNGKFKSYRKAAKYHGLVSTTLCNIFKQKRTFVAASRRGAMAFTYAEEESIIEEYVKRNHGEKTYKRNLLISIILQKIRTIKFSNPDRNFSKYVTDEGKFKSNEQQFVWRLAKRFDLIISSKPETKFDCQLCEKSYTLKNSLSKHSKEVHFL